jgi:hypothetical protein
MVGLTLFEKSYHIKIHFISGDIVTLDFANSEEMYESGKIFEGNQNVKSIEYVVRSYDLTYNDKVLNIYTTIPKEEDLEKIRNGTNWTISSINKRI